MCTAVIFDEILHFVQHDMVFMVFDEILHFIQHDMVFGEMLHFVQHDMVFMDNRVPSDY